MNKKNDIRPGKSKMTVMVFQLEGSDETLQEGLRKISESVERTLKPQAMRLVAPQKQDVRVDADDEMADTNGSEFKETNQEDGEADEAGSSSATPRRRSFKSPKILDLDLKKGKVSLEEYCRQKNAGVSDARRYLVITMWLKENLGIEEVNMDHIHTCYRSLGWTTPDRAAQPLAHLKHKGYLHKGDAKGGYKINHVGENMVLKLNGEV